MATSELMEALMLQAAGTSDDQLIWSQSNVVTIIDSFVLDVGRLKPPEVPSSSVPPYQLEFLLLLSKNTQYVPSSFQCLHIVPVRTMSGVNIDRHENFGFSVENPDPLISSR